VRNLEAVDTVSEIAGFVAAVEEEGSLQLVVVVKLPAEAAEGSTGHGIFALAVCQMAEGQIAVGLGHSCLEVEDNMTYFESGEIDCKLLRVRKLEK